jgi:very-short-patch-repair endonuclease
MMKMSRQDQKILSPSTLDARDLRVNRTKAEHALWQKLRDRQLGCKFRFQYSIGKYIADFACVELKLIVEVDGGQHCESKADEVRTSYLNSAGYEVVRFWNNEVLENIEGVVTSLVNTISIKMNASSPSPAIAGEGRGEGLSGGPNDRTEGADV